MSEFRVVLFSGVDPAKIYLLISRLHSEVPGCRVVGILYQHRTEKPLGKRVARFIRNLPNSAFRAYVYNRLNKRVAALFGALADKALRILHGAPNQPNRDFEDLSDFCKRSGISLHEARDVHSEQALDFVRGLAPDLGLVYGTGILKPTLFSIPRFGSINIHKRKLPDYRGGGPIGLWEMLDGAAEIGISVHQVTAALDAGAILASTVIPIEPYDNLTSLAIKADVVGNDLLVQAVHDYNTGAVKPIPQPLGGKMFRSPSAHDLRFLEHKINSGRRRFSPILGRPRWKLLLRSIALLPFMVIRNYIRLARRRFPLVVLYHHVITDRAHPMGMSTEHFLKQVDFLQRHYRIVSLDEGIDLLRNGQIRVPTISLTFDDGYADNYINLRAVTQARNVPCTLFICTEHIENGQPFVHDVSKGVQGFMPLTWEQVRALRAAHLEIGSHTRNHFDCCSIEEQQLRSEVEDSRSDLESHLGHRIRYFSFPFGLLRNISAQAMRIATETYEAVSTAYGGVNYPGCDVRHIRRIPHPSSMWELELAIQGCLDITTQAPDGRAVKPDDAIPGDWEIKTLSGSVSGA